MPRHGSFRLMLDASGAEGLLIGAPGLKSAFFFWRLPASRWIWRTISSRVCPRRGIGGRAGGLGTCKAGLAVEWLGRSTLGLFLAAAVSARTTSNAGCNVPRTSTFNPCLSIGLSCWMAGRRVSLQTGTGTFWLAASSQATTRRKPRSGRSPSPGQTRARSSLGTPCSRLTMVRPRDSRASVDEDSG